MPSSSPGLWPLPKRTLLVSLGVLVGRTLHIYCTSDVPRPRTHTEEEGRGLLETGCCPRSPTYPWETPKGGRMGEAGSRDGTRANGRRKGGAPRLYLAAEGRGDVTLRFAQRITHNCCSPARLGSYQRPLTLDTGLYACGNKVWRANKALLLTQLS